MIWTACVSAVKEAMAGRSLHVMVLLQGIKKLFGPHQDDLDCVSAVKVAVELQVEACNEGGRRGGSCYTQAPSTRARTS
jgi:hypothetical protein